MEQGQVVSSAPQNHGKTVAKLVMVVVGMFGFGFALVPLYEVFCDITGAQAIPSVSPGTAALYVNKTECFCFRHQPLKAGEEALMPMTFYIDPQLPDNISFFTLQYTLYDITANAEQADVVAMNSSLRR